MKRPQWGRKGKLALGGAAVAFIAWSAASGDGAVDEKLPRMKTPPPLNAAAQVPQREQRQPVVARVELERLARMESGKDAAKEGEGETGAANVFSPTSWYVPPPPPPPPPPQPPPKPTAPPLPFTYLGHYEEAPAKLILLVKGGRIYTVSEGEVIENTYLVGHFTGGSLELTYLPLSIKQSLLVGGKI
jgi:hypothetical protein